MVHTELMSSRDSTRGLQNTSTLVIDIASIDGVTQAKRQEMITIVNIGALNRHDYLISEFHSEEFNKWALYISFLFDI